MRLTPCALLPAVAYAANLYIYDPAAPSHAAPATASIGADAARLVVASRLGLDKYHNLSTADPSVLAHIDQLSAQRPLFAPQDPAVAFVVTQDSKSGPAAALALPHVQAVNVADAPSFPLTERLIRDLAVQAGLHSDIDDLRSDLVASSSGPVFRIAKDSDALASTLDALISQHYTILVLSVPKSASTRNLYGSYSMPSASHQKRQFKEAPLITDAKTSAVAGKATLSPNLASNHSTPLRGILPHCFASLSACQSSTRNCTGHGACSLIHSDRDASELSGKCYACTCKADVADNKNGKKTTRWGGPACQKKDVVVPFWLLASFSVFFAFVVSWGIGLLYTMGSQELPSVIGAGVSGVPRAK